MESTTTDICEWCKRPMLPEGAKVTGKEQPAQARPVTEAQEQPVAEAAAAERPAPAAPTAKDLQALGAPSSQQAVVAEPAVPAEEILRPLGQAPASARPGAPSHGLGEEATKTSVDVANYLAPGESLFRPLERPTHSATLSGVGDPLAQRRGRAREQKAINEIPDNIRLLRSFIAGLLICMPMALAQFAVTHRVPEKLYFLKLGRSDSFTTVLLWGLSSGILLGFGLGALLVQFKRGPFLGLLAGLLLGFLGLQTEPVYWGVAAGALTGLTVGRIATVGYRRALAV
jgi:hypothetical protein